MRRREITLSYTPTCCQPRASKIAPSGPMSLTPISLTRGCEICLSPDSSVDESLNEHCTCLSVDVLCEWYAVRMRRPGKSIRPSIFFVGAAMRSNATARRTRTAVGSTCRRNETMSRAVVVQSSARPRCGRLPTVPLIGKAMFVSSVGRSVAWSLGWP